MELLSPAKSEDFEEINRVARQEGCTGLQLYVDAPNEGAIAFYRKCGLHISNFGMQMKI